MAHAGNDTGIARFTIPLLVSVIGGLILLLISVWVSNVERRLTALEQVQAATTANQTDIGNIKETLKRIEGKIDDHVKAHNEQQVRQ